METKLTVPIAGESFEQVCDQVRSAVEAGAQMVELRCDYLRDLSVDSALRVIKAAKEYLTPGLGIIVTCRDCAEGGANDWPLDLRVDVLRSAIEAGVDFIDFEFRNFKGQAAEVIGEAIKSNSRTRLILSAHDFEGKFADIFGLYKDIKGAFKGVVPKIVYTAKHINDCFEGFDLLHETDGDRIVICMGAAGQVSRILARKLGSMVTFVTADGQGTAAGQVSISDMKNLYRFDSMDEKTEIYGIIGWPVGHSMSPRVHNAGFAYEGMNKVYLPLGVEGGKEEFDLFMDGVLRREWLNVGGFSVTLPHKVNALEYAKRGAAVEELARKTGAVNTLVVRDGKLEAFNTDYAGAMNAIMEAKGVSAEYFEGKRAAVIGAGGVARAVVAGLVNGGAAVTIYNRTVEKGERLAGEFGCDFLPAERTAQLQADIVVNCTSLGMHPRVDVSPVPKEVFKKGMVVFDTVYNPRETLLLRQAKEAGAIVADGVSMFVGQACEQFELFTGEKADKELFEKSICDCL